VAKKAPVDTIISHLRNATRGDRLERSYSVLLRPRMHTAPLGAIGVSWSRESTRFTFSLGGVE